MKKPIFISLFVFLPAIAFCEMIFPVLPTDLSLQYFYFLFGPITSLVPAFMQPNAITVLMHVFLGAITYLTLLAVAFVTLQSVFNGAGEGYLLGERMPDMDGPIKIGFSIIALIPDKFGFCSIQYFVVWFVLNGVGLANQLWFEVVNNYAQGNTLLSSAKISSTSRTEDVAKSLMYAALSTAYVDMKKGNTTSFIPEAVATNGSGTSVFVCDLATLGTASCDKNTGLIQYPVVDPGDKKVDSTDVLTTKSLTTLLEGITKDMMLDPLIQYALANNLNPNALSHNTVETFFGQDYCTFLLSQYSQRIQDELEPFAKKSADTQESLNTMFQEGWLSAAYYYWNLYGGNKEQPGAEAILDDLAPTSSSIVSNSIYGYNLGSASANPYYTPYVAQQPIIVSYIDTLYAIKNQSNTSSPSYNSIMTEASSYGVDQMFAMTGTNLLIAAFLSSDMDFYHLDYDLSTDRLGAFITSNYTVVSNIISFMQSLLMFIFVLALLAVFSGSSPIFFMICFSILSAFFLFMPFLSAIATTGAMGSIYVAALPGLIFGAGAFAWFLKVIEAVVAAPLVAMMLVFPSEDSERQLEHVLMQLIVLALRPALMILGFAISTKLCQLSIMFVGGAFNQLGNTITSITSDADGAASGGILFLVMMYEFTTMTTITFISRAYNIINLLPDSVFASIGVFSNDHEADQMIGGFEKAGQEGAKALSKMINILGGIGSSMNSIAKKAIS